MKMKKNKKENIYSLFFQKFRLYEILEKNVNKIDKRYISFDTLQYY